MAEKKINPDITKEFDVVGKLPALKFWQRGFGDVDLTTLTPKQAAAMVEKGFPFLKKKTRAEKKAAETEEEK